MLVKIINKSKTKITLNISVTNSEITSNAKQFKVDILEVMLELYNSDISWNKFYSSHSRHSPYETINNSNLDEKTKKLFNSFIKIESSKGLTSLYDTFNLLSAIYKNLQDVTEYKDINEKDVINYFEHKYLQDKTKEMNDARLLTLCNPILYYYKINPEEFLKRFWEEHNNFKYDYPELAKWLKPQISDNEHYKLLEKVIPYIIFSTKDYMVPNPANIYSMKEYLEYNKLLSDYKEKSKLFSVHSLAEIFAIAIIELYKNGAIIKKCVGCNKFFIPKNQNSKSCSSDCVKIVNERNNDKRNENIYCAKSTQAIKLFRRKFENYKKKKDNDKLYYALFNLLGYYSDICNEVREAIRENKKNINNDEKFLNNFAEWCDKIVPETPYINSVKNSKDFICYQYSPYSHKEVRYEEISLDRLTFFNEENTIENE